MNSITYILDKIISSLFFKGVLSFLGLTADYIWQLPIIAKMIPIVLFFLVDFVLGTIIAIKRRKFTWVKCGNSIIKLGLYSILLVISNMIDVLFGWGVLTDLVMGFVVGTEFLSIIQHMSTLGVCFPKWFRNKLSEIVNGKVKDRF